MFRVVRRIDDIPATELTTSHIQIATVVRLPFHLCTGTLFRIDDPDNAKLHLWLRNREAIPAELEIHMAMRADLECTDACLVNSGHKLKPDELEWVKEPTSRGFSMMLPNPGFRFLNETVAAHQMIRLGPYVARGAWPSMVPERELIQRTLVEFVLVTVPGRSIDASIADALFRDVDRMQLQLGSGAAGDPRDYSPEQLSRLRLGVQSIRRHAFYELRVNAVAAALTGNQFVAVVLGCAALEGAHATFVRLALRPDFSGSDSDFNSYVTGLLRDVGFYAFVQHSVRTLMEASERPPLEDLKACLDGVSMRNGIMHALSKSSGKYKMREYSAGDLNTGYGGIMKVFRAFAAAVESRERAPGDASDFQI